MKACRSGAGWIALLVLVVSGCASMREQNTAAYVTKHVDARNHSRTTVAFDALVLYPARELLSGDWLFRGGEAWNSNTDFSGGTSFWQARSDAELTIQALRRGPGTPPEAPITIEKEKSDATGLAGFVGRDAHGRQYLFKVDRPAYPELGTGATLVSSRLMWALGYRVPAAHIVRLAGTGNPRYEGQRAVATEFINDVRGYYDYDWFRFRREARALRLASAWIHDVDRTGRNGLVALQDGRALYYQIDFDSSLGAWQGRPKLAWHGHRYWGDPVWHILTLVTAGAVRAEPEPVPVAFSPAVGRFEAVHFDPERWRMHAPSPAFDRMEPADAAWIAEQIQRIGRTQLEAIVAAAEYSSKEDAEYMVETLLARRARILEYVDRLRSAR